jgi:hypothetical protein
MPVQQREATRGPDLGLLENLANEYALTALNSKGRFERALILARGMAALREAVKPLMPAILSLMDSPLGFLTDRRGKDPYPEEVVADCLIEAVLRGCYPVGNEWNIISGRAYITKEGFARLVRELPGFTDLRLVPGVPRTAQAGAVVPFRASWRWQGKPDHMECDIPVRLNSGMGADAAIGKATRKMLARLYSLLTGSQITDPEGDEAPLLPGDTGGRIGPDPVTAEQLAQIRHASQHMDSSEVEARLADYGVGDPSGLSRNQAVEFLAWLQQSAPAQSEAEE